MELPKGFMMFSSVQLPIEKYLVLDAVCIIIRNMIDDIDANVVEQAIKLAHTLIGMLKPIITTCCSLSL